MSQHPSSFTPVRTCPVYVYRLQDIYNRLITVILVDLWIIFTIFRASHVTSTVSDSISLNSESRVVLVQVEVSSSLSVVLPDQEVSEGSGKRPGGGFSEVCE